MSDPVEAVARAISDELYRQYQANRNWDEAKDVIENVDAGAVAKAALAALPGEPVAWMYDVMALDGTYLGWEVRKDRPKEIPIHENIRPLYAAPPLPSREAIADAVFEAMRNESTAIQIADRIISLLRGQQ